MNFDQYYKNNLHFISKTIGFYFSQEDEEEAIRAIHQAIKNGINYIDTAP